MKMKPTDELTIGQLSERCGVATSALRYYEQRGLIHSLRTAAGHRRYPRAVARRVAFIMFAQNIGLALDEIATELAKLPKHRVPSASDWGKLSRGWAKRIDARIAKLQQLKEGLTACIGCGCLSLQQCRLANPEDRAALYGAGPVILNSGRLRRQR